MQINHYWFFQKLCIFFFNTPAPFGLKFSNMAAPCGLKYPRVYISIRILCESAPKDMHHGASRQVAREIRIVHTYSNLYTLNLYISSIDMYNNDVGKKSGQKIMKQTGDLKAATLYFAS